MNSAAEFFGILDERARAAGQNEALWISVQGYVVRLTNLCGYFGMEGTLASPVLGRRRRRW